jgi:hypothetical protein
MRAILIAGLAAILAAAAVPASAADNTKYGYWPSSRGPAPPPPPAHLREWRWRSSGWYAHVQECRKRYRSYDAASDTYRAGSSRMRCRLKMP